jgi:Cu(I)/Ag(I) efflux system membrane protein CusA/SilA
MRGIAVPMVGGMVSSTVLTLIVIPAVYGLVKGLGTRTAASRNTGSWAGWSPGGVR